MSLRSYSRDVDELTPRMRAVLASAASGLDVDGTARRLHVSRSTVKAVRAATLARTGARTITQAYAIARDRGEL